MSERRWSSLVRLLLGAAMLLVGCGDESQLGGGADLLALGEPSGVPVVFRVDYPDIYGPIDVQVGGRGALTLQVEDSYDCDRPAFFHEGGALEFGALSSRYFTWRDVVVPDEKSDCLVIDLSIERTISDLLVYGIDFPWFCYPYSVSYKYGPHALRDVWTIESAQKMDMGPSWNVRASTASLPSRTKGERGGWS